MRTLTQGPYSVRYEGSWLYMASNEILHEWIFLDELESFKNMLNSFDDQAKLERLRLKEEHHQCTQINLNDKKNQALRDFVAAIEEEPRDGDKIKEALKRYLTSCTKDRLHK